MTSNIREIYRRFREDAKALFEDKENKIASTDKEFEEFFKGEEFESSRQDNIFKQKVISKKKQEIVRKFESDLASLRELALEEVDKAMIDIRSAEFDFFDDEIDIDLLSRLNIIAQSGIKLNDREIMKLVNEAYKSKCRVCVSKLKEIADSSDFVLEVTNRDKPIECANKMRYMVDNAIKEFDGNMKIVGDMRTSTHLKESKLIAAKLLEHDSNRLMSLEDQYRKLTTSDLAEVTTKDLPGVLARKISIHEKEMDKNAGTGEQAAKTYSEKMDKATKKYFQEMNKVADGGENE